MIPTIPVALTAAPATAGIATTGLEPLLWVTVGLMAAAMALIIREAFQAGAPGAIARTGRRVRLHVVPKPPKAALDAA